MGERLKPGAEPRLRPADALGDRADPAGLAGQDGDDAVGLTQLVGAQHDAVVAVDAHSVILAHARLYSADAPSSVSAITPTAWAGVMPSHRGDLPGASAARTRSAHRRPARS